MIMIIILFSNASFDISTYDAPLHISTQGTGRIICHVITVNMNYAEFSSGGNSPHLPVGCEKEDFCKKLSDTT